jgi:antitoxin component YwqK of YwqJK toxin-antitoxin module
MAKKKASTEAVNTIRLNSISFYRLRSLGFFELLYQAVAAELGDNETTREKQWNCLSGRLKAIYGWWSFLTDVQNGGLSQFFYNNADRFTKEVSALLNEAGCEGVAGLIDEAVVVYREHQSEFDVANPGGEDGLFETMTAFDKLDNRIVPRLNKATKDLEKFVRGIAAEFAVDEAGQPINPTFSGNLELKYPDGTVHEQATVKKGRLTGAYRRFFDDGTLEVGVFYAAGEVSSDYWPSGQVKHKTQKKGTLKIDEWFYESGAVQKRYVTDKTGYTTEPIRVWHENGQLAEEMVKHESAPVSRKQWFEDGSPRLEATYKYHKSTMCHQIVVLNAWDKDRKQIVKSGDGEFCDDGIGYDTRYELERQDMWTHRYPVKDGLPHGKMTTWCEGVLWSVADYDNGIRNGVEIHYYDNGRIRSEVPYTNGKAGREKKYPKFEKPRPIVRLTIRADEQLYSWWKHRLPDEYPSPKNQAKVEEQLIVPNFLQEIYEKNLAGRAKSDESTNEFDYSIGYLVWVNEDGDVDDVKFTAAGMYCCEVIEDYPPILKTLKFKPGRIGKRKIRCRVAISVHHTFEESGK